MFYWSKDDVTFSGQVKKPEEHYRGVKSASALVDEKATGAMLIACMMECRQKEVRSLLWDAGIRLEYKRHSQEMKREFLFTLATTGRGNGEQSKTSAHQRDNRFICQKTFS